MRLVDATYDRECWQDRVSAELVESAAERLDGIANVTPLERSERLSAATGAEVWLKREDLQLVRSYKLRGAYAMMSMLTRSERRRGVVCASAGNHAQGVAHVCRTLGIRGRVFVPRTTPQQKRERIAELGGDWIELIVAGGSYDESAHIAKLDAADRHATLVPAFDHPAVINGQGSVVVEAVKQLGRDPDMVLLPVGGGGLLAGASTWIRARCPATRVVGVEPEGAASMSLALAKGAPTPLREFDAFVDGAAVRTVGQWTYAAVADCDVEVMTVPEGAVCTEMLTLYQSDGIIAEPAGALATAALGRAVFPDPESTVVCVVSGGNNDIGRYAEVVERSLVHEGRKHYFLVEFAQEPGSLRRFASEILGPGDDITFFQYSKQNGRELGPALVGLEVADAHALDALLRRMADASMSAERLPPNSPLSRFLL